MAGENEVDLLMSVDFDASETLKTIAALRTETTDLRKEQKELDRTTAEGAVEYERLNTQIKANTKTIRQYEKEIVNTMTQEKAQEGSIKSMRAELSNAKAAYASLSKEERESAKGRELLDKTASLNAELKDLEGAYGDNQRKVGEYELAGKSLKTELKELTTQLQDLTAAGLQNSETYKELAARAAELKSMQSNLNAELTQMGSNTRTFDTVLQGAQAVTAAYGAWKSTSALLGIENEALDETMKKMVVVMGALQSLTTLQALAQKQSNIYRAAANILQKLGIKQTTAEVAATSANVVALKAEATAENASTAAKTKGIVATKLITAAQWLWNAAMSANPVLILVVSVLALIAGITTLIGWMNRESTAAKGARAAQEAYNIALEESEARLTKLDNAFKNDTREMQLNNRALITALKERGATEEEIRVATEAGETALRNLEIEHNRDRVKETQNLIALKQKELQYWVTAQSKVREGGKRWKEYAASIKEAEDALVDLQATLDDANFNIRETMQDQIEADAASTKSAKNAAKERAEAAKSALDASISAYEKELDAQKKYNEALLKAAQSVAADDLKTRQSYAQKIFSLNQTTEKAKLDNLRKHNRITEKEYADSLAIMKAQLTVFSNGQIAELNSFFESERKAILGMLTRTLDEELAEVEKQYNEAIKRLESIEPPVMLSGESQADYDKRLTEYENFVLEQANIAIRLEKERDKKLQAVRDSALATQVKQIEDASTAAYASDLVRYQNNERKKLDTLEKQLREQVSAKKAAGIETYNEDAQLENLALQRTALNLNRDLILAGDNSKKKYDAKVKAYNAELELAEGNADKQLEITHKLADAERELIDSRIDAFRQWADAAGQLFDGVTSLMSANLDAQLQKVQETYDKEALALADKYASGLLTEAEYNRETLKLKQDKAKEEAKIERQRAIQERVGALFTIAMNTAMGIMNAVSTFWITGGMPWAAIIAALGAVQIAGVLAQPLPKAARGGIIAGPSHQAGGAVIEAEGGEAIMTKRAVSMFGPVLSALNELGGGVPFAGPLGDGGYSIRSASNPRGATADEMAQALKEVTIYTTVEDINRGQDQYAKIQARGTVL